MYRSILMAAVVLSAVSCGRAAECGMEGMEVKSDDSGRRSACGAESVHAGKRAMCAKLPMEADGIVRLSKVELYPEYADKYVRYAVEVGEISLLTEPGVLTMYALCQSDDPCTVTILETYASREAYRSHIASAHFRRYKQETMHMVKSLTLLDQTPLNPANIIDNFILHDHE